MRHRTSFPEPGTRNPVPLRRVWAVVGVLTLVLVVIVACGAEPAAARYHCPMHPTYIADKPGDCPICGMRLVAIEERVAPTSQV